MLKEKLEQLYNLKESRSYLEEEVNAKGEKRTFIHKTYGIGLKSGITQKIDGYSFEQFKELVTREFLKVFEHYADKNTRIYLRRDLEFIGTSYWKSPIDDAGELSKDYDEFTATLRFSTDDPRIEFALEHTFKPQGEEIKELSAEVIADNKIFSSLP